MSLKTNCPKAAKQAADLVTSRLSLLWTEMRLSKKEVPAPHLLFSYSETEQTIPTLSEALALYQKVKGADTGKHGRQQYRENNGTSKQYGSLDRI